MHRIYGIITQIEKNILIENKIGYKNVNICGYRE